MNIILQLKKMSIFFFFLVFSWGLLSAHANPIDTAKGLIIHGKPSSAKALIQHHLDETPQLSKKDQEEIFILNLWLEWLGNDFIAPEFQQVWYQKLNEVGLVSPQQMRVMCPLILGYLNVYQPEKLQETLEICNKSFALITNTLEDHFTLWREQELFQIKKSYETEQDHFIKLWNSGTDMQKVLGKKTTDESLNLLVKNSLAILSGDYQESFNLLTKYQRLRPSNEYSAIYKVYSLFKSASFATDKLQKAIDDTKVSYYQTSPLSRLWNQDILPLLANSIKVKNNQNFTNTYYNTTYVVIPKLESRHIPFSAQHSFNKIHRLNVVLDLYLLHQENPEKSQIKTDLDESLRRICQEGTHEACKLYLALNSHDKYFKQEFKKSPNSTLELLEPPIYNWKKIEQDQLQARENNANRN